MSKRHERSVEDRGGCAAAPLPGLPGDGREGKGSARAGAEAVGQVGGGNRRNPTAEIPLASFCGRWSVRSRENLPGLCVRAKMYAGARRAGRGGCVAWAKTGRFHSGNPLTNTRES